MFQKAVGRNIRSARESAGLIRKELAHQVGKSTPSWLYHIELGRRSIGLYELAQIAQLLDRPLDFFFNGATTRPRAIVEAPTTLGEWLTLWPAQSNRGRAHYQLDEEFERLEEIRRAMVKSRQEDEDGD